MEAVNPKLAALSVVLGAVASWFARAWPFIALTFVATALDFVTGWLAGRANEGINSRRAVEGAIKKVGFFCLLALGMFLDVAINQGGADFFELPFDLPIAYIVTMWIVITEAISICENLGRLGVPIPKPLLALLKKAEGKIDNDERTNENEQQSAD